MSISKKGRRKITVGNQICFWYVAPDDDSAFNVLHIVSEDKCLILSCPLQTKTAYVISKGSVFQTKETDGTWNRYLLPFDIQQISLGDHAHVIAVAVQNGEVAGAQLGDRGFHV